jgi:hypothetical protein
VYTLPQCSHALLTATDASVAVLSALCYTALHYTAPQFAHYYHVQFGVIFVSVTMALKAYTRSIITTSVYVVRTIVQVRPTTSTTTDAYNHRLYNTLLATQLSLCVRIVHAQCVCTWLLIKAQLLANNCAMHLCLHYYYYCCTACADP